MLEVDATLIAIIFGIYFVAGIVKGVLGFGLPIITMSLLPFFIQVQAAVVLSAVVQPATNVFQIITSGNIKQAFKDSWPIIVTLVPGIVLGASLFTSLDAGMVLILVGVTIAGYSILELLGLRFSISPQKRIPVGLGFGVIAGGFGALTSLNGWAFIMYLMGIGLDRPAFRSAIGLLFLVSGFLISSSFWAIGILDWQLLQIGIFALVPAFLGMWLGNKLGELIPADVFRKILLVALVLIGAMIVWRGIREF